MAYTEEFKSKLDWAMPFQRTGKFPLDRSSIFSSYEDALKYAKQDGSDSRQLGGTSYVGQIVTVYGTGNGVDAGEVVEAYLITAVGASASIMKLATTAATGDLDQDLQELAQKVNALEGRMTGVEGRVTGVEGRLDAAEPRITGVEDRLTALEPRVTGAENDIDALEGKVTALETGVSGLNTAVSGIQTDISGIKEAATALAGRVTGVEGRVTTAEADIVALKASVSGHTGAIDTINGQIATLQGKDKELEASISGVAGRVTGAEGKITTLEGKVSGVEGRVTGVEGRLDTAESDIDAAEGRITGVEGRVDALESKITNLNGAMHYEGKSTTDPTQEAGPTVSGVEEWHNGDVVLWDGKEYIYDGDSWEEFGNEGDHVLREELDAYVQKTTTINGHALTGNVTIAVTDIANAATKAEVTGALTGAKAYTDEKIGEAKTAISSEIDGDVATALASAKSYADEKVTTELKPYAKTTDVESKIEAAVSGVNTTIGGVQSALDAATARITGVEGRVTGVEGRVTGVEESVKSLSGAIETKVDKVTGKQLSTEDYTTAEKQKLAGIATGAQVNVLEGIQVNSEDVALVSGTKKVNIAVPTGALASKNQVAEADLESALAGKINNKVDQVAGKQLSTEDYTTAEKSKLAGIEAGAEVNVIETIKVNGAALSVTGTKEVDIAVPTGALASKDKVAEVDLEEAVKAKLNAISEGGQVSVENIIVPTGVTFVLDGGTASGGAAA